MNANHVKLHKLRPADPAPHTVALTYTQPSAGYWHGRIWAQLEFAQSVSELNGDKWDCLIGDVLNRCLASYQKNKCVSPELGAAAESMLLPVQNDAKSYEMICVSHAHIDMNWMWPLHETVAVTVDTFRTMLDLLNEYPQFTFSQSQASTYKMVADYAPAMMDEIKKRVREGRWEVTASHWVEADKNMPSGESFARHVLYTKRYLAELFGLPPNSLNLDFEPDSFGHSRNIPEILHGAGIRYYYHQRGKSDNVYLSKWMAPSGAYVLLYQPPAGYSDIVDHIFALEPVKLCKQSGIKTMLKMYGVGDHGGGPTRRDIERILDMQKWPVYPRLTFGRYSDFFAAAEKNIDSYPVIDAELNPIFTGCYTSQSRIKLANKVGENVLGESEAYSAFADLSTGLQYPAGKFAAAWQNVLFSQFHDIITGACVVDTREYAMGKFQETLAFANTQRGLALRAIASSIDTSRYAVDGAEDSTTEGAGAGSGVAPSFGYDTISAHLSPGGALCNATLSGRSCGLPRIFHIFNPAAFDRDDASAITIWDWPDADIPLMEFRSCSGEVIPHQILDSGTHMYWYHTFVTVLIKVKIPAFGWTTVTLSESADTFTCKAPILTYNDGNVQDEDSFVLENSLVKVAFDPVSGVIKSFYEKESGTEWAGACDGGGTGVFRLLHEEDVKGMSAWRVGRIMGVNNLTGGVRIKWIHSPASAIRKAISIEASFGGSKLAALISLDEGSAMLRYDVECDWHELGSINDCVPQLNFFVPLNYKCEKYGYDVPFGYIERRPRDLDQPANSFIFAPSGVVKGLMLWSNAKYGFKGSEGGMSLTLIRSSCLPDPTPEQGKHRFSICLGPAAACGKALADISYGLSHCVSVLSDVPHPGVLPATGSFITVESGAAAVSAIKMPEDGGNAIIIRVYEIKGADDIIALKLWRAPAKASLVDLNESVIEPASGCGRQDPAVSGDMVTFTIKPYSVATLKIEF